MEICVQITKHSVGKKKVSMIFWTKHTLFFRLSKSNTTLYLPLIIRNNFNIYDIKKERGSIQYQSTFLSSTFWRYSALFETSNKNVVRNK